MAITYDAIIIGTGQAGPFLAHRLAGSGMRVAIIERNLFGGTCVNTGCIPTKTMVASAYAAHLAYRASDFGVDIAVAPDVNMRRVSARKDAVSEKSRTAVEAGLRNLENCTVYQGHAPSCWWRRRIAPGASINGRRACAPAAASRCRPIST